ncbi:MAG: hypothetical protein KAI85_02900, partial [Halopseudomonas aestusnigri]|nr:hypothetical protein [Halopseudomonas aestusnigri]
MKEKQMQKMALFSVLFISLAFAEISESASPVEPAATDQAEANRVYRQTPDGKGSLTEEMIES